MEILGPSFPAIRRDAALQAWITALAIAAGAMCAGLVAAGYGVSHPVALAVLAILAAGAEHEGIRLTPGVEVSVGSILCVFAAVVFGPLPAIIVGAAGLLADLPRRDVAQPVLRWLNWTSVRVFAAGGAGLVAAADLTAAARGFWGLVAAVAAAFVVETVVDLSVAPSAPAIRGSLPWRPTVCSKSLVPSPLMSDGRWKNTRLLVSTFFGTSTTTERSLRSCATTTSVLTGTAIRISSLAPVSHCSHALSPSQTDTTR